MNTVHEVILERDDENEAPPSTVLKVTYFQGGTTTDGETMESVLYLAIGEYDEGTYESSFKSSAERQFSVNMEDFLRALTGLGALDSVVVE